MYVSGVRESEEGRSLEDWTEAELRKYLRYNGVTISVQVEIQGKQRILNLTEVERILAGAEEIALGECSCRRKIGRCDSPVDTCLSLGNRARELIAKGLAVKVDLNLALKTLKRAHEAGLVHITYTIIGREKPQYICSCCSCCCHSLNGLIGLGFLDAVVTSRYVASDKGGSCTGCGKCVQRCPFKARAMEDGKMRFDKTRCFGCGLCASTCPSGSISLVLREKEATLRRAQKSRSSTKSAN